MEFGCCQFHYSFVLLKVKQFWACCVTTIKRCFTTAWKLPFQILLLLPTRIELFSALMGLLATSWPKFAAFFCSCNSWPRCNVSVPQNIGRDLISTFSLKHIGWGLCEYHLFPRIFVNIRAIFHYISSHFFRSQRSKKQNKFGKYGLFSHNCPRKCTTIWKKVPAKFKIQWKVALIWKVTEI